MICRRFDVVNRESPLSGSSATMSAGFIVGAPSCVRPVRREIDVTLNDVVVDLTAPETSLPATPFVEDASSEAPLPETGTETAETETAEPETAEPEADVAETDVPDTAPATGPTFADLPLGPALQRTVAAL